jgi:hypothetical protein
LIDYLRFYVPLNNFSLTWLDWLRFYVPVKNFHFFRLYGDRRHHCREWLQNLGLCSALRAFELGGIFIVPHLLWHGTSVFPVSSEGLLHSVTSKTYDTQWGVEDTFQSGSSQVYRVRRVSLEVTYCANQCILNVIHKMLTSLRSKRL